MFDGRQRVVSGKAGFRRSKLCEIRCGIRFIRMLGVCIIRQDKAIGNRHGDLAELVIRFCVIQTNGVVDARIVARQIDAALLQTSVDGDKAVLVLSGRDDHDEDRGKLTTYLHPFLRGKMYRYLEANLGAAVLPKDEMQRVKQAQRLHKEELIPLDEVAQTLGVSAEKAAQLIGYETKALSVSALSGDDSDDDPLAWLQLDQHALTPEQAVYRQVCTEELEQLFRTLSAKDRAILGHTYGVFGYEKLSADELGLREMLSPDGVTKARKAALERLRSRYPGSGLHLWRDVYHALKDMSDI